MAITASQSTQVDRPLDTCFDYVDDWRNVPDYLVGVERFSPVGDKDQGLGSVFDVVVHAGVKIKTRLEVTDYVQRRLIEFESVKGFQVRARWHFEPVGDDGTLITCETTLHPPFGPAGKAMAKVLEPAIGRIVQRSATQLRERIESA